ncbi:choline dehydrogenase, partial [Streptomyces sp. SID11233]|nr:choline dehydrogenase [Streptomyces sp. SID11233]
IATARAIVASGALSSWGAEEVAPGPAVTSAADLAGYARRFFGSYCHPVGTCAMGEHENAVVDPALRVRGLTGLRIADASVLPS